MSTGVATSEMTSLVSMIPTQMTILTLTFLFLNVFLVV